MNNWTGKTSRRAFLHGSTALAGGMLVGCGDGGNTDGGSAEVIDEAYENIFDGKTLTGWHGNPEKIGHGT